jgi:3',5'-cyclic AMP phosphodiesterase CpdA
MKGSRRRSPWLAVSLALLTVACSQKTQRPDAAGPAPAGTLFRFAIYGDTRDNHDIHREIVEEVMSFQPALVLQTGDLVHHGDAADEWRIFDEITGNMRRRIPYYPTRGSHDMGSHGYYEQRVTQPVLSGNKLFYSFEKGNVHFVSIDTQQALDPASEEGSWLEADLARAQAQRKLIIPFFHKAIFSIGPHAGEPDVVALRPILHALFRKHGVGLAFQGHDHIYYRTARDGITYVTTGGGGAPLYDGRHPELGAPGDVFEKVNHFCITDIYRDRIAVTVYRRGLSRLDRFVVPVAAAPAAAGAGAAAALR